MVFSSVAKVNTVIVICIHSYSKGTTEILNAAVINGCTSGFMELDLLRRRAEKISSGSTAGGGLERVSHLVDSAANDWSSQWELSALVETSS